MKKIKPVECPYCWHPLTKDTVEMARHFKYLEDQILLWRSGWQQVSPEGIKVATAKLKRLKKLIFNEGLVQKSLVLQGKVVNENKSK
jgi:hypothetical protein